MTTVTFSGTGPLTQAIVNNTPGIGSATIVIIQGYTSIGINAFQLKQQITSVTIPTSVRSIGKGAFGRCSALSSVTFTPTSQVTSIGQSAFYSSGLTSITIPTSVTSIGEDAFGGCTSLTSVTFTPTSQVTSISHYAFASSGLTSVIIPDSVIRIGFYAFTLSALRTVYISKATADTLRITVPSTSTRFFGKSVKTILLVPPTITFPNITATYGDASRQIVYSSTSDGAVTYTSSNTSVATISGSMITFVGGGSSTITANQAATTNYSSAITTASCNVVTNVVTFSGTGPLTRDIVNAGIASATIVTIQGYTSIGGGAFLLKRQIISVTIGNSVTSIDYDAFAVTALTSVTIPDSVTSIGEGAFAQCTALTSVTLGNSVTSIGNYAFYNCTGLTSVIIPDSVTSIGEYAFKGSGLTTVYISQKTADTLKINVPSSSTTFFGKYPVKTILLVPPQISFDNIIATFGEFKKSLTLFYHSKSTAEVTYSSSNTSVATITGSMITFVSPGSSTITANQAATTTYSSAITTSSCTVNANTPSNPALVASGPALVNFFSVPAAGNGLIIDTPIIVEAQLRAPLLNRTDTKKVITGGPGVVKILKS